MRTERDDNKFVNIHRFLIIVLLIIFVLIIYGIFTDPYDIATLKRESRSGYLPDEIVTVPYSDTMRLGDRIWYDGKMWTVIRFE